MLHKIAALPTVIGLRPSLCLPMGRGWATLLKHLGDHYDTQQCLALEPHIKRLLLTTAIIFVPFIIPAHASGITAEVLAYACRGNVPDMKKEKDTEQNAGFCNAYISGWDDARFAFLQGTTTFCPPQVTHKDMSVVFFDYLATHKEARKLPAAEALMLAFKDRWPCD